MPVIGPLTSFTANTRAKAAEVTANFSTIRTAVNTYGVFADVATTISAVHTYNAAPLFTVGASFGAAVTVNAGGLNVVSGGITVTAGGLSVNAGGAAITGGVTVSGTVAASAFSGTTFTGSGAGLTALPAGQLTGALPAISGALLTALNANEITTGTLNAARLPSSVSALTITTLTSTTGIVGTLQGAAVSPRNTIGLADGSTRLLTITSASAFYQLAGGMANPFSGATGPLFSSSLTGTRWLACTIAGSTYYLPLLEFA